MKTLKIFLLLLISCQLAFASDSSWVGTAGAALMLSGVLLGLIYMVGFAFNLNDLRFLATEETYQLIATLLMVIILLGADNFLDTLVDALEIGSDVGDFHARADEIANGMKGANADIFGKLKTFARDLGEESSKSKFCSLSGLSVYISPCTSFSALTTPVSLAFQSIAASAAEAHALTKLVELGYNYGFTLFLPIGIVFRAIRFTRGAGGLFIALGVALYLVMPATLIFTSEITQPPAAHAATLAQNIMEPSCDVDNFAATGGIGISYHNANSDEGHATGVFNDLNSKLEAYIYVFLIYVTLTTIICLTATFVTIRAITGAAGAEIDISPITRIA